MLGQRQRHMVGLHGDHHIQIGTTVAQGVRQQDAQRVLRIEGDDGQTGQIGQADFARADHPGRQQSARSHTNHRSAAQRLQGERRMGRNAEDVADIGFLQGQCRDDLG